MSQLEERFEEICHDLGGRVEERQGAQICTADRDFGEAPEELASEGYLVLDEAVVSRADIPSDGPRRVTHQDPEQVHADINIYDTEGQELQRTRQKAIFIGTDYGTGDGAFSRDDILSTGEIADRYANTDVPIFVQNWETGNTVEKLGNEDSIV